MAANVLFLLGTRSPEVLREHVVSCLSPQETSDLLASSRISAALAASTWKHLLAQTVAPDAGGHAGGDEEGKQESTAPALYWKHRFRLELYMARRYCDRMLSAFSPHGNATSIANVRDLRAMDSSTFVTTSHAGETKVWNAESGKCTRTFFSNARQLVRVDGRTLLCLRGFGLVDLWDTGTGRCNRIFESTRTEYGLNRMTRLTPSKLLVIDNTGGFTVCDIRSGACVCVGRSDKCHRKHHFWVLPLNDSVFVIADSFGYELRDTLTGKCIRRVVETSATVGYTTVESSFLLCLKQSGKVHVEDVLSGSHVRSYNRPFQPLFGEMSRVDSRLVLSHSVTNQTVYLWDSKAGLLLHTFHSKHGVHRLVPLNPAAAFITVDPLGRCKIWNIPRSCFDVWEQNELS